MTLLGLSPLAPVWRRDWTRVVNAIVEQLLTLCVQTVQQNKTPSGGSVLTVNSDIWRTLLITVIVIVCFELTAEH